MTGFLVETYSTRMTDHGLEEVAARADAATAAVRARGGTVVRLRSYLMAEDEMCFHVFEAASAADVRRAAELAGIEVERIVETETVGERSAPRHLAAERRRIT